MPAVPAIKHTASLIETHSIVLPRSAVGSANAAVEVAQMHAKAWAEAHGLELMATSALSRSDGTIGVTFDVEVGRGDISLDQRVPGVLDNWRWSGPRVQWWRKIFNRADGRQGRTLAARDHLGPGKVLAGPWRGSDALGGVLSAEVREPFAWSATDQQAQAERLGLGPLLEPAPTEPALNRKGSATGLQPGCSCHLGGPFVDVCPIHHEADS